ncbi:MAG: ferrous iron transport protein A [Leptolyngbya sp. DLM2.Bin15]|nr:MAG: ferrous iron transport protein A [Leptolyngbya sp. DLM2.Bin15]
MHSGDDLVHHWLQDVHPSSWQGFTYVSDRSPSPLSERDSLDPSSSPHVLSSMDVGDRVQIIDLNCGDATSRLRGMGFMPGVALEIVSVLSSGSVIVRLGQQSIGLNALMASQVQVQPMADGYDATLETYQQAPIKMNTINPGNSTSLLQSSIGDRFRVIGYTTTARTYKRKLLAMGLTPGTEFIVTRHAPLGDPTEIEVRNFHLSLRKAEAEALRIERIH